MTPRSYALWTLAGWFLIVAGLADLVGRWFWGVGTGMCLLGGIGWRKVAEIAWLGVQRMEDGKE